MTTKSSGPSLRVFQEAFEKLRGSISAEDARSFGETTLDDVWTTAREIERQQGQRQSLCNMRRIEPFLKAIDKYSKVIEVLCNGTPYLPFVWAPIKLFLQLASEHTESFESLISAYTQIAEALPRFDRLALTFKDNVQFESVLALVYVDILEFHRRAYKFFTRRAWKIVFASCWRDFSYRFDSILDNLAKHRDLVDREAQSIDIAEARASRRLAADELDKAERDRGTLMLQNALAWLAADEIDQENNLDQLSARRQHGTCEWVLRLTKMISWMNGGPGQSILWLRGIPGSGKSTICSKIIEAVKEHHHAQVVYYFCNAYTDKKHLRSQILRSIIAQLLRANTDLASYICENFAYKGLTPSLSQVKQLLPQVVSLCKAVRIVLDGVDECVEDVQRHLLLDILPLGCSELSCKVLISSREGGHIGKSMKRTSSVHLREQARDLNKDIGRFVKHHVEELRESFSDTTIDEIERRIVEKAQGMFLWVKLVIDSLELHCSLQELQTAVDRLPEGLEGAYGTILQRISSDPNVNRRSKATRILQWMACSFRPLKLYELQDGIAFHVENTVLNQDTQLRSTIAELCKPLIEEGIGSSIEFVHFSAKEYILHATSGPFVNQNISHHNIAFSCIAYLRTSLGLIDPAMSEDKAQLMVVNGFHGLHFYADDYWFHHFIKYMQSESDLWTVKSVRLFEELQGLLVARKPPGVTAMAMDIDSTEQAPDLELKSISAQLEHCPAIHLFLRDAIMFRDKLVQSQKTESYDDEAKTCAYELQNDPTMFSRVRHRYQDITTHFLEGPSSRISSAINSTAIQTFREIYGASAFHCRYHNCPQIVRSFASRRGREEHERCHTQRLKCLDSKCTFYAAGFKTVSSLKSHNAKYHARHDGDIPNRVGFMTNKRRQLSNLMEYQRQLISLEELSSHNQERRWSPLDDQEHERETDNVTMSQQSLGAQEITLTSGTQQEQENHVTTSSYWTVAEQRDFVELEAQFGTNWQAIANEMKSKTAVMVQNYYWRLAEKTQRSRTQSPPNEDLPTSEPIRRKKIKSVGDHAIDQELQGDEQGTKSLTGQNQRLQPTEPGGQVPQVQLNQDDIFTEPQHGGFRSDAVENLQIIVPPEVVALGPEKAQEYLLGVRRKYTEAQDLINSSQSKLLELSTNSVDNDLAHVDNVLQDYERQARNGERFFRNLMKEQETLRAKQAEQDGSSLGADATV